MRKTLIISITLNFILIIGALVFFTIEYNKKPNTIFSKNINSVVEIKATTCDIESFGSGVVITTEMIITNLHVISYTQNEEVFIHDEILIRTALMEEYVEFVFVKSDSYSDLALLKSKNKNSDGQFRTIKLSNRLLSVGDICYSIGNASNLSISMSKGIVGNPSIILEIENKEKRFVQTDLSIASGSSGGALLDEFGKLIGITTLRLRDNLGNVIYGYNYSIPLSIIEEFVKDI